jgi:hypothetical protein
LRIGTVKSDIRDRRKALSNFDTSNMRDAGLALKGFEPVWTGKITHIDYWLFRVNDRNTWHIARLGYSTHGNDVGKSVMYFVIAVEKRDLN